VIFNTIWFNTLKYATTILRVETRIKKNLLFWMIRGSRIRPRLTTVRTASSSDHLLSHSATAIYCLVGLVTTSRSCELSNALRMTYSSSERVCQTQSRALGLQVSQRESKLGHSLTLTQLLAVNLLTNQLLIINFKKNNDRRLLARRRLMSCRPGPKTYLHMLLWMRCKQRMQTL